MPWAGHKEDDECEALCGCLLVWKIKQYHLTRFEDGKQGKQLYSFWGLNPVKKRSLVFVNLWGNYNTITFTSHRSFIFHSLLWLTLTHPGYATEREDNLNIGLAWPLCQQLLLHNSPKCKWSKQPPFIICMGLQVNWVVLWILAGLTHVSLISWQIIWVGAWAGRVVS